MKIEEAIKSKFSSEQQKALLNIIYTANWLNSIEIERLKPYGISPQQYNVLRILRGSHPKSMTVFSIKDRMLDKTPNTTRLLDKLLNKNLITRVRCEQDRRVVHVNITEFGLKQLSKLDLEVDKIESLLSFITDEEANTINSLMDKIRDREII